jgi:hypothetical protein
MVWNETSFSTPFNSKQLPNHKIPRDYNVRECFRGFKIGNVANSTLIFEGNGLSLFFFFLNIRLFTFLTTTWLRWENVLAATRLFINWRQCAMDPLERNLSRTKDASSVCDVFCPFLCVFPCSPSVLDSYNHLPNRITSFHAVIIYTRRE